ncbi:MAG: T9SS type A sorting domain-containing protein [Ignavibacteria bacterium]|nr:T9SS type A sorting domain-containing protein [Ignavibacteria bacterium]
MNATISRDFELNLQQKASGNELAVTVQLENNGMSVKGASLVLSYNPEVLRIKDVTSGTLFGEPGVTSFFAHMEQNSSVRVDAAMLGAGRTVSHSGDLATVRFEVLRDGDPGLVFGTARLRDGENRNIVARLKSTSANAPQGFALSQNFPNPFTPMTTIAYQVAENTTVTIDVYNALGAKVATIANGPHDAGSYQAQLDASGLPSGLYYYTMRAGSFTATRSMTIAK